MLSAPSQSKPKGSNPGVAQEWCAEDLNAQLQQARPSRLAVLDQALTHHHELLGALQGERVCALSADQEPIAAISQWLADSPSNELHVLAHGAPGRIELGSGINRAGLLARAAEIGGWGVERIYLWSCRVGSDLNFISALEELSGAQVVASPEGLGLGKSLSGSSFPELAEAVAALPLELVITGTLNFDNFWAGWGSYMGSYGGLNFSEFQAVIGSRLGGGYAAGTTSGENVIFSRRSVVADILTPSGYHNVFAAPEGETFNLQSLNLTGALGPATVTIGGFLDGNYVNQQTVNLSNTSPTLVNLGWSNMDEVRFVGPRFVIDDIVLSPPPGQNVDLGAVGVAAANAADANPSNLVITAGITETNISTLGNLTGTGNAYSITISDSSVDAAALNTLDGKTTVAVNASAIDAVSGTAAEVTKAFNSAGISNLSAGNDSVTISNTTLGGSDPTALNTGAGTDSLTSTSTANQSLTISGMKCGTIGPITFSDLENVILGAGNDTATITTGGSLTSLNAGSGTDILNANASNNTLVLNASGSGSVDGTSISNLETINLLAGDDKATIDLMNPATAASSLSINGGAGNDALDIQLSDQEFAQLENTDGLMKLSSYLSDPIGKSLDIGFGEFSLNASGFESASFNHDIPFSSNPLKLNSVAASASDTASVSGLEGLNLDVGGTANVQTPVTLKSTSDVSTVEGNVKSDAHATEVLGISTSTLYAASDLSVGSALQSIVTGSAESTSGIAIANALVDTQHGIDLSDTNGLDALASGGSSTVVSTSTLTATSIAQTVGDGSSDSGARLLDGAWANTIAQDHLGLGSSSTMTIDSESNATVSTSMLSKLTSTATANDGLAAASSQLLSSTGIENLNAEVGGLGLVTAINQGVLKADATSTTDDAKAMGFNKASAGILDSTFTFGITDSTITAKDFNSLQVSATSTGGDAWSKLQSSSTGLADLTGTHSITDAGAISAIASDQGFSNSATVSGSSTAFASQEAIGMSGYDVYNHSGLTLSAQALVTSESNSSAVGG